MARARATDNGKLADPAVVVSLFNDKRWAWAWLVVRVYLGWTWLNSGWGKLANAGWTETGAALKSFWERAVAIPAAPARPAITFDWYRSFLQGLLDIQAYTWFSKVIVASELLLGVLLILGIYSGFAALAGGFLNWNFMMAGTASVNPVMLPLSLGVLLAWKIAGYWGLDRWLLTVIGTPWQPGTLFQRQAKTESGSAPSVA